MFENKFQWGGGWGWSMAVLTSYSPIKLLMWALFDFLPLQAEIDACIEKMSDDNKLMRSEDTIFVI